MKTLTVEVVLKLWRNELEQTYQAQIALPELPTLPYVRIVTSFVRADIEAVSTVTVFGRPWRPTKNEGKLLLLLARRSGRAVSKEQIFDALWPLSEGRELLGSIDLNNALKSLVKRLRQRIARMVQYLRSGQGASPWDCDSSERRKVRLCSERTRTGNYRTRRFVRSKARCADCSGRIKGSRPCERN